MTKKVEQLVKLNKLSARLFKVNYQLNRAIKAGRPWGARAFSAERREIMEERQELAASLGVL